MIAAWNLVSITAVVQSGDIGIAVRLEKTILSADKPGEGVIALKGKVSDVAYYGNESHILPDTETGVQFTSTIQHDPERCAARGFVGHHR